MALVAVCIRFDSPGPVIFRQIRLNRVRPASGPRHAAASANRLSREQGEDPDLGNECSHFVIYKFRTMFRDTDDAVHREFVGNLIKGNASQNGGAHGEQWQPLLTMVGDGRVTRVGGFLRSRSLDELPQVFNVLKGEMSLVGPRPALPYEVEMYKPGHMRRLEAVPGITGLWQVTGRSCVSFERMVELDVAYVDSRSILLDLKILLLTIPAVFSRKGAA